MDQSIGLITFLPSYISNLVAWYDASNPLNNGTRYADNALVSSWSDISTPGNTATQADDNQKPLYILNAQNRLPALRCDAVGDLLVDPTQDIDMIAGIAVICVVKGNNNNQAQQIIVRNGQFPPDGVTWEWALLYNDVSASGFAQFVGINTSDAVQSSGLSTTNILDTPHIVMGQNDGTNLKIYIDHKLENSTAFSGTLKTNLNRELHILWGPGGNQFTGDMYEFIVTQGASDAEIKALHQYLSRKWSIQLAA